MMHPRAPRPADDVVRRSEPLRSLWRLLRPHRAEVLASTGVFLAKDCPQWVLPPITAAIIDTVVAGGPLASLGIWGAVALVLLAINYPMNMLFVGWTSRITRTVALDLRRQLADRLQRLSVGFHRRQSASLLQTKIVRDVEQLELLLQQAFPALLSTAFTLAGAIVMTAITVPQFVPVFLLAPPVTALLIRHIRAGAADRNDAFRREIEHLSAGVGEMASLIPITRGHGLETVAVERVTASARRVKSAGEQLDAVNGKFGALSWISYQTLGVGCLLAAAAASITGLLPITPGEVVLLSTYFTVLTGSLVALLNNAPVFTRGVESMRSIGEVMDEPDVEENEGKTKVDRVVGRIELQRVVYRYAGDTQDGDTVLGAAGPAQRPALDDITLTIAAGETIALVGPSGSGKSTLLNLVLGFVRPTTGRVLLDGVDMNTLDMRSVRSWVSVVPQESILFDGTVRENIAYGLAGIDDERVLAAMGAANALDILDRRGLDMPIGDRGDRLSGGQRQRLSIARALVREPRILVLDEATSALDTISEAQVRKALQNLVRDRTTFIAAHRLSTIQRADRIAVVDRGRIVEIGSHDELLERGRHYAGLIRQQTS